MLLNDLYSNYAWEILLPTHADIVHNNFLVVPKFLINSLNIRHWQNVSWFQREALFTQVLGHVL